MPLSWLEDLRSALNRESTAPEGDRFYLVGETFAYDDRDLLRRYVEPETMLDGQFDFPLKARLCEAVFTEGGDLSALAGFMDGNDAFYGPGAVMTTWIGNHDIPRAIHFASREIGNCREGSSPGNGWDWRPSQPTDAAPYERLAVAFAVLMTNPGIPLIYYGDEIGSRAAAIRTTAAPCRGATPRSTITSGPCARACARSRACGPPRARSRGGAAAPSRPIATPGSTRWAAAAARTTSRSPSTARTPRAA
ncbi:MAG: alpha-amylase family glycosyl hydrolase [Sandaracinaceae bacterium]|nr:alpha-amylase family glycosyl hydrolase [Sandaracinaceae bacterium]